MSSILSAEGSPLEVSVAQMLTVIGSLLLLPKSTPYTLIIQVPKCGAYQGVVAVKGKHIVVKVPSTGSCICLVQV